MSLLYLDKYIKLIYYTIYQFDIWGFMMKRQNIRKLILIISMLLFPIIIWYMSPYLIMQGAMDGVDNCPKKALSYGFKRSKQ